MSIFANGVNNPADEESGIGGDPIGRLVAGLADPNGLARLRARRSLVSIGASTVPALTEALSNNNWRVRWEAAKALTEIADPSATDALVAAMEDDRPGVRWIASEGVIALGPRGLVPLLKALIRKSDSTWFRLGTHHVLRALEGRGMDPHIHPVLNALNSPEPSVEVPLAAAEALDLIRRASSPVRRTGQRDS